MIKRIFIGLLIFITTYYVIYWALFAIPYKNKPLIYSLQEKMEYFKDISGKSIEAFDTSKPYDIVFLGSSHCYRGFDPHIFEANGLRVYNLGSSSQAPLNSYSVLTQIIKRNAKHIVLEVYPVASNLSGIESYMGFIGATTENYSASVHMAYNLNDLRCYNLLSIKPLITNANKDLAYNIPSEYNGYVANPDTVASENVYDTYTLDKKLLDKQLLYIEKIITYCKQNNIEITLVYAPVPKKLTINSEYYFTSLVSYFTEHYNVAFINNGRNHHLIDEIHFFDNDHMNSAGVAIFNKKLIKAMKL